MSEYIVKAMNDLYSNVSFGGGGRGRGGDRGGLANFSTRTKSSVSGKCTTPRAYGSGCTNGKPLGFDLNKNGTTWDEAAAVFGGAAVVASGGTAAAVGLGLAAVGAGYMAGGR